ncbi:hypothetical protein SERLA73DRAFT_191694 [Serpula lacrymans var. lacrymans S7.3]|uniref:RWD domain-containing protein n=2 Tax=Serpula lacrymans var. lacrymans TaxID=341189 RepID=F8QI36_SERL3|nr:uncharacterized protein SERLADRAFT_462371 [Serpula lacrymans var. lacrymans S7.9]EGN92047.1 hypothetical protein SERLA73DRAFT_191694 [Serpula lacrymans var. lacrymans S7.3]EGO27992.1 hypothetical protein SERLADRAFT_462371 [Serpula lacrymans var. lacrymans S7.9]
MDDGDDDASQNAQELDEFIANLMLQPEREQVASELGVLQSIYGDSAIKVWHPTPGSSPAPDTQIGDKDGSDTIRYVAALNLLSPHEDVSLRILVSIPPSYPNSSPPQLQLLSRYIGAFGVDSSLFGSILRTFISVNGAEWSPDSVCVFDGLQNVLERCSAWYEDRLSVEKAGELMRGDAHAREEEHVSSSITDQKIDDEHVLPRDVPALPDGIRIVEAESIVDRRSVFIGRACEISHPSQVPLILSSLMADRRISRAAHPIINAWRCQVGNLLHQDNDDDGETAAGSRLAHLLQILEINNVLVVVTRYFGGIHLGPDRFKHINQAARNALELGGFLDQEGGTSSKSGRGAGKGRKR